MTGKEQENDNDLWVGVGLVVLAAAAAAFLWAKIPLAFLLIAGALAGAIATFMPRFDGPDRRRLGIKLIATGLLVGLAFYFLSGPIGADAQVRRFNRALHESRELVTFTKHPWAVVPVGSAFLSVGFGGALLWRAS